ncbi:response regulator [Methylorubrum extorquens]|jgi:two-component system, chemotaxis family, chemotaxis protein CheY|uniref:Response regulator receiver (CheY-like protein) n=2 Tax=Methylorubrum extorquens TaxID=408 RepID=C5B3C9_METEA|nr:response regulator [Methylorubrum extorquens]ACS42961.1 Putative response regulator receiver (CheY-like protein) [Methylorubrum extorquens AM1]EHP90962.1 response regulator receiver protein [Methylorubrum extorquens DSM 13060]MCP1546001.1 two-component system chemotaxis response regulator CheY [Methylorubrum extorquens]MCP1590668.1 two-component system chemotaxis response regulator CheY [Methylorubrum extorquens]
MSVLRPATEPLRATRTLLVDDDRSCVVLMMRILEILGQREIDVASDGQAAYAMMRTKEYGLVVSDLHMKPWSGLDLLRRVRANELLRKTPFVLTTMDTEIANVGDARDCGADAYILKPYTPAMLREKIEPLLRRQEVQRRLPKTEEVIAPVKGPPPTPFKRFFKFAVA